MSANNNAFLYFGNDMAPVNLDAIPTFLAFESELKEQEVKPIINYEEISFECQCEVSDKDILKRLIGYNEQRKAKPVRKRLINRLAKIYKQCHNYNFTITPIKNGKWELIVNGD